MDTNEIMKLKQAAKKTLEKPARKTRKKKEEPSKSMTPKQLHYLKKKEKPVEEKPVEEAPRKIRRRIIKDDFDENGVSKAKLEKHPNLPKTTETDLSKEENGRRYFYCKSNGIRIELTACIYRHLNQKEGCIKCRQYSTEILTLIK